MSDLHYCDICNKSFNTKKALNIHRSKIHKHNENIVEDIIKCEYCNKDFEFQSLVKRHQETCTYKYISLYTKLTEKLETLKKSSKQELEILQECFEKELNQTITSSKQEIEQLSLKLEQESKFNKELDIEHKELLHSSRQYRQKLDEKTSQYNKLYHEHYELEKKMKELQTNFLILETSCKHYKEFYDKHTKTIQPTNNNNITIDQRSMNNNIQADVVNIASSFEPLTPEFVYEQMKDISQRNLANYGAEYIATHAIKSKIGINMLITDVSRRVCSYINKNNQLVKDPSCTELIKLIIHETSKSENVKKALELAISYIDDVVGTEDYNKVTKHVKEISILSKDDPEFLLYETISNKMSKLGATKQTIEDKQKSYIEEQVSKAQSPSLPTGVTLKDTLPIDTRFKPAEGTIDYQVY